MKVYLAGKMRGVHEFNFPAFAEATTKLRASGYEVCSPHEHDLNAGWSPKGMKGDNAELGPSGFNLQEALLWDLTYVIKEAEAVVVLPGWETSEGAQAEVHTAKALSKPVLTLAEALNLDEAEEPAVSPRVASLQRAIGYISGDRNASYGPPTQDFTRTAALWTAFGFRFVQHEGAEAHPIKAHQIANALILLKSSRLAWQPDKADSWDDISGYAGCGHECAVEEANTSKRFEALVGYIAGRYGKSMVGRFGKSALVEQSTSNGR